MALLKKNVYSYGDTIEQTSYGLIESAERRLAAKKMQAEDIAYELKLVELDAFSIYKNNVGYYMLNSKIIRSAADWLKMVKNNKDSEGNKLDKRRRYPEKDNYEWLTEHLKELLDVDDFVIESYFDYNFGQADGITFSSSGHKWQLMIPVVNNVQFRSYKDFGREVFMLTIKHYDSDFVVSHVGSTFEEDELKDIMKKGIIKYAVQI